MESEARYTVVGATLLAFVAALIGAVIWLKHAGSERDSRRYTIFFEQQALDGLQIGGDVSLRGIKVGRVESYRLDGERINRVRVTVRVLRDVPVRVNTVAIITRNIVTGIAQIVLVTPEPPGAPLGDPPAGERYPLIAEGRSDLDEFTGKVTQLGEQAAEALDKVNRMLSAENRDAFARTLANVRDLTASLNKRMAAIDTVLAQFGAAATRVAAAGDRVALAAESAQGRLDTVLVDAQGAFGAAQRAIVDAQRAVAEATRAVAALQSDAGRVASRVDASAQALDEQVLVTVTELRVALDAATRTLDRLQDPRGALLGPGRAQLGPGEKLP
jgi:phospholipid/cholesterol/gamma-HCH transport system substrate-binding protein